MGPGWINCPGSDTNNIAMKKEKRRKRRRSPKQAMKLSSWAHDGGTGLENSSRIRRLSGPAGQGHNLWTTQKGTITWPCNGNRLPPSKKWSRKVSIMQLLSPRSVEWQLDMLSVTALYKYTICVVYLCTTQVHYPCTREEHSINIPNKYADEAASLHLQWTDWSLSNLWLSSALPGPSRRPTTVICCVSATSRVKGRSVVQHASLFPCWPSEFWIPDKSPQALGTCTSH